MKECKTYPYRFLARVVIEAKTPLIIGSGIKNIKTDAMINRDVNGMPFIPGTTIAGLLRHSLYEDKRNQLMGYQSETNGVGSMLIVSEGKILDSNGNVIDGLYDISTLDNDTRKFLQLPIRQHAKINHQGVTVSGGKFDEEVVLKGTRFCFELEMLSEDSDKECDFKDLLNTINSETFRIGGGSRSGLGSIDIILCKYKKLDFSKEGDFRSYLAKSSSLSKEWSGYEEYSFKKNEDVDESEWIEYKLELHPEDFLFFGSGYGNGEADMTFVNESYIEWRDGKGTIKEQKKALLIPASSVKGAVAHRTAYYYNKNNGVFADMLKEGDSIENHVGTKNKAVLALFGSEGEKSDEDKTKTVHKKRGNVLFSDVIKERNKSDKEKILNHVAIDRFTGGAKNGALFSEETLYAKEEEIEIQIMVNKSAFTQDDEKIRLAFEKALINICKGMLPLGGGVNRGNGIFYGKLYKKGEMIYE